MAVRYESETVISNKLKDLIERFADHYVSSGTLAKEILEQARSEGIPNEKVRELIESALEKRGLSERQKIRAIPAELKRSYRRKSDMMSHSDEGDDSDSDDEDHPLEATDFIKLPDSLFDDLISAISIAKANEQREVTIYHDRHKVVSVRKLEVA